MPRTAGVVGLPAGAQEVAHNPGQLELAAGGQLPGAVKSTHGTHRLIARLDRLIDPRDRVQLAGDYLAMPSVNGSIVSGEVAAQRLKAALALH
jgi:hypothetical protein